MVKLANWFVIGYSICCVLTLFLLVWVLIKYADEWIETKNERQLHSCLIRKLYRKTKILYVPCNRLYSTYFVKPKLLMVDTGATTNFISEKVINEIYPQYKEHILYGDDVITAAGTVQLNSLVDVPMSINNISTKVQITLLEQTDSIDYLSKECGYEVIGIVGTDFLKNFNVTIDFDNLKITSKK